MTSSAYFQVGPDRYREKFGLTFEEVRPGMTIRHRPGIDVSQRDNHIDAVDLINNAHLHYDSHYAAQTEWADPLTVSTMTVQRFFGMTSRSWYRRRRLLGIDSLALTGPVQGDDTLYAETTVTDVSETGDPDVGQVSLTLRGLSRDGRQIAKIDYGIEVYKSGRHPEDPTDATVPRDARFAAHHATDDEVLVEQTGLVFEDLRSGETFEHWPQRTITAQEVRLHALRSLEINPRWHDEHSARRHGEAQVWEPLLIGVVTGLTTRTFGRVVANLGWTDIALPAPMRPGQTVRAESTVIDLRASGSRPDQGIATVETRAYADGDTLVCSYRRALLIYRRDAGPYAQAGY